MSSFTANLRIVTPTLLGGVQRSEPGADTIKRFRGTAVRGVLRTFARALIGPYYGYDSRKTHRAEAVLFGAASSDPSTTRTLMVRHVSPRDLRRDGRVIPCPNSTQMNLSYPAYNITGSADSVMLQFTSHPAVERGEWRQEGFREVVWAVLWTAVHFGGFGLRTRRGYGSTALEAMDGIEEPRPALLPNDLDGSTLESSLRDGLQAAHERVNAWLGAVAADKRVDQITDAPRLNNPLPDIAHPFFILESESQICVGQRATTFADAIKVTMQSIANAKKDLPNLPIEGAMSGRLTPRLASPLWVHIFRSVESNGVAFYPVYTYSPRGSGAAGAADVVNQVFQRYVVGQGP